MKKTTGPQALITIRGEQSGGEGLPETVEFITAGSYLPVKGGYEVKYDESELTGMEGTRTRLFIENGRVTVERSGQVSTQMIFEKGRRHVSAYGTPFGTLLVGVNASSVDMLFDDAGGELTVDYSLEIDHALAGRNRFSMTVNKRIPGVEG